MKLKNKAILILILLTGSVLRFYKLFKIPFTHDEFSALFRTHFQTFSELIEKGVKVDGHPAGVQVFLYYWTKLFGYSEWVVKILFIIAGILSIYLIYLIAKKWYNETVALISAAFIATIEYMVMYSQIARPYSSGLFFSLLMVNFWTNLIKHPEKKFNLNLILYIISASLCTYDHYFSLLFAAIVGVSGLFLIQRKYQLKYILGGITVILLFMPYFNIFLYQLHLGGVGEWLGKPHNNFLINYLGYSFDYYVVSYLIVVALILLGFWKMRIKDIHYQQYILFSVWFFLPFLIGFFYSKYINSVLQFSVLIFSFPFLYFILFGHIRPQKARVNLLIVLVILSSNVYALVKGREYYTLFYHSPYKQILVEYEKTKSSHKNEAAIIDSDKKISEYYIRKLSIDTNFVWSSAIKTPQKLIQYLKKQSKSGYYLYLGCLSSNRPFTIPIIQSYYPTLVWQKNYARGTAYLFSKAQQRNKNIITCEDFDLKNNPEFWTSIHNDKILDTVSFSGKRSYLMTDKMEWSPTYTRQLWKIIRNKDNFIDITVKAYAIGKNLKNVLLVSALSSEGKNIYWRATPFDEFMSGNNKWVTIYLSMKISDIYLNYSNIQLKVYIWNKGHQCFFIDDFTIKLRQGNPVIYGLTEKI